MRTPTLREQLAAAPEELDHLVRVVASLTAPQAVDRVAARVRTGIRASLDPQHAWPGNMRELEQCAR